MRKLYPDVISFELLKPLPYAPEGTTVNICHADGRECLFVNGISMPYATAQDYPDFFRHIYLEEHRENFKRWFWWYAKSKGRSEDSIERCWKIFNEE